MGMVKHSQSSQNRKFAMALQEVMNGVHYGVYQDQNCYKLDYWLLIKAFGLLTFDVQRTQKRKFINFCNILRKSHKNHDCFCVLLSCKTFRYFTGFQSCLLLLVFANIPAVTILPE